MLEAARRAAALVEEAEGQPPAVQRPEVVARGWVASHTAAASDPVAS
jgi:hypothetical protein